MDEDWRYFLFIKSFRAKIYSRYISYSIVLIAIYEDNNFRSIV